MAPCHNPSPLALLENKFASHSHRISSLHRLSRRQANHSVIKSFGEVREPPFRRVGGSVPYSRRSRHPQSIKDLPCRVCITTPPYIRDAPTSETLSSPPSLLLLLLILLPLPPTYMQLLALLGNLDTADLSGLSVLLTSEFTAC
ncbi:hypothetical protein LY76DRAFT_598839 [Colletotrichum caudatum]|nr:hypothetical protein LY76DRAFT_598839 [Colletotrichum caudatum]